MRRETLCLKLKGEELILDLNPNTNWLSHVTFTIRPSRFRSSILLKGEDDSREVYE